MHRKKSCGCFRQSKKVHPNTLPGTRSHLTEKRTLRNQERSQDSLMKPYDSQMSGIINSQMSSPDMLTTKRLAFPKKVKAICRFCGGKSCPKQNWKKCADPAIQGLHSNWVTPHIIASQRLSNRLIQEYDIMGQFRDMGVTAVLNLEEPGEHPFCGDGIYDAKVGFSYNPIDNVYFFNIFWKDLTNPDIRMLLQAVQFIDFTIKAGGKILVHCHAGQGRTGTIIASYLHMYKDFTSRDAIYLVRSKRRGALKKEYNRKCVIQFEKDLKKIRTLFPMTPVQKFSLDEVLLFQRELLHGMESRNHRNIPKILNIILEQFELYLEDEEEQGVRVATQSKKVIQLSNAMTLQNMELFQEEVLTKLKVELNSYKFKGLFLPGKEPENQKEEEMKRTSKVILNDISMRTINEVSKEDFKGDVSDISREVAQINRKNQSSSRIVLSRDTKNEELKIGSAREEASLLKKRSVSINSVSPRTSFRESAHRLHFAYLAQLMCDFFQGLKTRVVDKELLEVFYQLSKNEEDAVIIDKKMRLKLTFMGRLSQFCNLLRSNTYFSESFNFTPAGEQLELQRKSSLETANSGRNFDAFMKRLAIALLQLKDEENANFNGRVMLNTGGFKNEKEIDLTVEGILRWKNMTALSPSQTMSPTHRGQPTTMHTNSTFSKSVLKMKVVEREEEKEESSNEASSSLERVLLHDFNYDDQRIVSKDNSVKSTAPQIE